MTATMIMIRHVEDKAMNNEHRAISNGKCIGNDESAKYPSRNNDFGGAADQAPVGWGGIKGRC